MEESCLKYLYKLSIIEEHIPFLESISIYPLYSIFTESSSWFCCVFVLRSYKNSNEIRRNHLNTWPKRVVSWWVGILKKVGIYLNTAVSCFDALLLDKSFCYILSDISPFQTLIFKTQSLRQFRECN